MHICILYMHIYILRFKEYIFSKQIVYQREVYLLTQTICLLHTYIHTYIHTLQIINEIPNAYIIIIREVIILE